MAIPSNYIDKIKKEGESRPICPPADHVRVNNENFEADNLDEVLDQVAEAIDEAADGYNPPADGIPKSDLATAVQESLNLADSSLQPSDKAQLQGAITQLQNALNTLIGSGNVQGAIDTFNEVTAFLNGIDTDDPTLANQLLSLSSAISALQTAINNAVPQTRTINGKPLSSNVTIGMSDIQGLVDAINNAGSGAVSVSVPNPSDGTFTIHVGSTDYTINLNHTHGDMAKVSIVEDESDLPPTLDTNTIYGISADGESISMVYIGGIPFYGGGGGDTTPTLRQPQDDSTIDVGSIETGESTVEEVVSIQGRNLTEPLTVAVTGTGYSIKNGISSISAADANAGTSITVVCSSSSANAAGTLTLSSNEVTCECNLIANVVPYTSLSGVKLTGTQWLDTGYKPKTTTEFSLKCRFIENSNTNVAAADATAGQYIFSCGSEGSNRFNLNVGNSTRQSNALFFVNDIPSNRVQINPTMTNIVKDMSVISYANDAGTWKFKFIPAGNDYLASSVTASAKSADMNSSLKLGYGVPYSTIFKMWDLVIYELIFYESGVEVCHFIPVSDNGTPGLYDTINDVFISSETSSPLEIVQ